MLELEDALSRLSVIHVAGTKGKVRRLMRFDKRPGSSISMKMESLIIFALLYNAIDKGVLFGLENYTTTFEGITVCFGRCSMITQFVLAKIFSEPLGFSSCGCIVGKLMESPYSWRCRDPRVHSQKEC